MEKTPSELVNELLNYSTYEIRELQKNFYRNKINEGIIALDNIYHGRLNGEEYYQELSKIHDALEVAKQNDKIY